MAKVVVHEDLLVYQRAFTLAMELFEHTKGFPSHERYALTDQIRRSSRSVCANLAEAWRKRRYRAAFLSKLTDVESELAETQTWIAFAHRCAYLSDAETQRLRVGYDGVARTLANMVIHVDDWLLPSP
ncbi:MAG: four helix bundle protein [Chloroflexales bacterium]